MPSTRVIVLNSADLYVRTVHAEMAAQMVSSGEAEMANGSCRGRAIRLVTSLIGAPARPCSPLTPHSYGCSRYVRKEVLRLHRPNGESYVSAVYNFKHIDPDEQRLTVVGRRWGVVP